MKTRTIATSQHSDKYAVNCRPGLARQLEVIGLDKEYHRGKGDYLYYTDGEGREVEVLDFLGGFGASMFGHSHPRLLKVALDNLTRGVPFNAQGSFRFQAGELGEKLNRMLERRTGSCFVTTLASTGAESVEASLKHARMAYRSKAGVILKTIETKIFMLEQRFVGKELRFSAKLLDRLDSHGFERGSDSKQFLKAIVQLNWECLETSPLFIALSKGFHGKTMGAVQLTHNDEYRRPFTTVGLPVTFIGNGNTSALERVVENETITYYVPYENSEHEICLKEETIVAIGGVFIEPLQGEGGIHPVPTDFMQRCREICSLYNIPLIFDEIQSGMGRTGTFLYSEQLGVTADYYLLSKSLGGGISKISALLVKQDMYEEEFGIIHTSTFAGRRSQCVDCPGSAESAG